MAFNNNGKLVAAFVATALTALTIGWTIGASNLQRVEARTDDLDCRLRQAEVSLASLNAQICTRLDAIERQLALLREEIARLDGR